MAQRWPSTDTSFPRGVPLGHQVEKKASAPSALYWRATPHEALPCFKKPVSSMTPTACSSASVSSAYSRTMSRNASASHRPQPRIACCRQGPGSPAAAARIQPVLRGSLPKSPSRNCPADPATRFWLNSGRIRTFTSRSDDAHNSKVVSTDAPAIHDLPQSWSTMNSEVQIKCNCNARLDPLGHESAEEMLDSLLGAAPELAPLKRLIVERTEGNPFFMEEAVQALLDESALARDGEIKLIRPLAELKIPPTVQAVLAARIDRLPAAEKELLQTLAVIGKDLALSVIGAVAGQSEARLEPMLTDLQLGEFIYEQPSLGGTEYTFKHALTQGVTYNSLLAERRRALHERTARAIETLYLHQLEDRCSSLFRHYSLAHQPVKALRYAHMTAEQALNRGAYSEAASTVENGLKLVNELAEDRERLGAELTLRSIESAVARVLHGAISLERERAVRRMCELGEKLGGGEHSLRGLIALCNILFNRGESARGLELAQRCIALAEETAQADLLAAAHEQDGLLANGCGKQKEAISHMQAASDASRSAALASSGMLPRTVVNEALALQLLGRVGEAANLAEEGLRRARESGHLFSLAVALINAAGLCQIRRQPEAQLSHAHEAMVLSEENGFAQWRAIAQSVHGIALTELGQLERAVAELQESIAVMEARGRPFRQAPIAHLARCYSMMNRTDEAVSMLDEALADG